jgi:hypothetical protein
MIQLELEFAAFLPPDTWHIGSSGVKRSTARFSKPGWLPKGVDAIEPHDGLDLCPDGEDRSAKAVICHIDRDCAEPGQAKSTCYPSVGREMIQMEMQTTAQLIKPTKCVETLVTKDIIFVERDAPQQP